MLISRNYDENYVPRRIVILNIRANRHDTGATDPSFLAIF